MKQQQTEATQSKTLNRLKQELSFVSGYKNPDTQMAEVVKSIEK